MFTALCEMIQREQRAAFNDDLPVLLDLLGNIPTIIGTDKESIAFQSVTNLLCKLRAMVARVNGLCNQEVEPPVNGISTTVPTSTFPQDIVMPGGRHDNDDKDIVRIKILPTENEIRSSQAEFLPSADRDQPHFLANQSERHIDTQFRLFRHDVFGEPNDALGGFLVAVDNEPTLLDSMNPGLGGIRAYSYPRAHISYIAFDRRRGLEAQISFPHPPQVRHKSTSDRRKWWEESSRLQEGILLCFVFRHEAKSSLIFFTVSEKCTDTMREYSLTSRQHYATITTKLASFNQREMEVMTKLSCGRTKGNLIEFPSILPSTFVSVLENLQSMQRLGKLPLAQWILPDRSSSLKSALTFDDVPPPLHARAPGFTFSLKSMLKDHDDDLSLTPRTRPDDNATIEDIEARTELDRGQCEALVAALTREVALIQGPPGTGKSYLGIQLMKVLLASKSKTHLGPIVVV